MYLPYEYNLFEFIGNCGVVLLIITYYLTVTKRFKTEIQGAICNIIAAVLLLINLLVHPNLSGIVIEIFWISISILGIYKSKYDKKSKGEKS